MANQTWKIDSKIFEDATNKLRIKVQLTHGAMGAESGEKRHAFSVTWGEVSLLPNEGEDIVAFTARVHASSTYEDCVATLGKVDAESQLKQYGIRIAEGVSMRSLGRPMEALLTRAKTALAEDGVTLSADIEAAMKAHIDANITPEAREEARRVFERVGDRQGTEAARG